MTILVVGLVILACVVLGNCYGWRSKRQSPWAAKREEIILDVNQHPELFRGDSRLQVRMLIAAILFALLCAVIYGVGFLYYRPAVSFEGYAHLLLPALVVFLICLLPRVCWAWKQTTILGLHPAIFTSIGLGLAALFCGLLFVVNGGLDPRPATNEKIAITWVERRSGKGGPSTHLLGRTADGREVSLILPYNRLHEMQNRTEIEVLIGHGALGIPWLAQSVSEIP